MAASKQTQHSADVAATQRSAQPDKQRDESREPHAPARPTSQGVSRAPSVGSPYDLLHLQRTIGNRAVQRLLRADPPRSSASTPIVQRKKMTAMQQREAASEIRGLQGNTDWDNLSEQPAYDQADIQEIAEWFANSTVWKHSGQTDWLRTEEIVGDKKYVSQVRWKNDGGTIKVNFELFILDQAIVLADQWSATGPYQANRELDFHVRIP